MNADQTYLLRKSFSWIEQRAGVAALVFYRRLFELDPALRPMFKTDIEEQSRKLMDMLGMLLSLLTSPSALEKELEDLGFRHAGYGVRDEHYVTVGSAMLHMLETVLGTEWTPPVQSAWVELYRHISDCMQRGAARAQFHGVTGSPSATTFRIRPV